MKKVALIMISIMCAIACIVGFTACDDKENLKFEYMTGSTTSGETYETYFVSAANTNISGNIVVPATYKELDVTLNPYIFKDCQNITSITISEGIKTISQGAFKNCYPEVINLPSTITYFGEGAFDHSFNYNLTFAGTKGQWRTQIKGYHIYSYKVTCSDGEITVIKNVEQN